MSCVEKRHVSHRMGSMLHHRFPNGFTDLFMDETDREVSTLTDRAFRSLCVGDDAVYNDDILHGYSPFSCHKPLAGEPLKKSHHHKESKKHGQNKKDKSDAQPWNQQQQKNISHMSSFLKALSATKEGCEGMLNKNGGTTDSNGESWDKSALRSIQRELSEFSSDYHSNLTDGHYKNHRRNYPGEHLIKTGRDVSSGKSSKVKNGKSSIKIRKLNIKNFFLHSEFSPFQAWRDLNRFTFSQEDTSILPPDNIPKWYDLPFYKELTETHTKKNQQTEETQSCQKDAVEPPPPTAPIPPPSPQKILPKPLAAEAPKRCLSNGADGNPAPWRRTRSGTNSATMVSQLGMLPQDNTLSTVAENIPMIKNEARSVEVKAIEEVSSLASTPFSICQLMTPIIPSRQPTETSEILQTVFSPSALDLPRRPHSEAKLTPEPPIKRDNYKSLASSILFNLKDNRKRVKSRYSPPKFKTLEAPESCSQSPQLDSQKNSDLGSDTNAPSLSSPATLKDDLIISSPALDSTGTPTGGPAKLDGDGSLSDDYLLSNLLQSKREAGNEENPISLVLHSKRSKNSVAKKQNYPSLNLYKKASPVDGNMKYLQVPQRTTALVDVAQPTETNELSQLMPKNELSPKNTKFSPNTLNVNNVCSPTISPHAVEKRGLSSSVSTGNKPFNVPDNAKVPMKDSGSLSAGSKDKDVSGQHMKTIDVIRAAREAINAAKNKALLAQSESIPKPITVTDENWQTDIDDRLPCSMETIGSEREISTAGNNYSSKSRDEVTGMTLIDKIVKKDPPPVPKKNFAMSDLQITLDKQKTETADGDSGETKTDLPEKNIESPQTQGKAKHIFSARQNNYIKYHRYTVTEDEREDEHVEGDVKVKTGSEKEAEEMPVRKIRDGEHIIDDLHALKELERARLGDRICENAKNKADISNIDEEARAKSDLISRELRNIKKGMLSMRGNTSAKREIFVKKEKEQSKQDGFTKRDSNVLVNKALINDNYDKAKLALEEIISDRKTRKNKADEIQKCEERASGDGVETSVQQSKTDLNDSMKELNKNQISAVCARKETDLRERLGDLRDHNHMRQILAQTEPSECHRSGIRVALPGMDKADNELLKTKAELVNEPAENCSSVDNSEFVNMNDATSPVSEENIENLTNKSEKLDAPSIPPRSKRGGNRDGEHIIKDHLTDAVEDDVLHENAGVPFDADTGTSLKDHNIANNLFNEEALSSRSETSSGHENRVMLNSSDFKSVLATDRVKREVVLPSKYQEYEKGESESTANNMEAVCPNSHVKAQEIRKVKQKAPFVSPNDNAATNAVTVEPDKMHGASDEATLSAEAVSESSRKIISPLLLVNGVTACQSPPDQASLSSKSSYFSVESAMHRNTETESNMYQSLENLIVAEEGTDEREEHVTVNSQPDAMRREEVGHSINVRESESKSIKKLTKSPQEEKVALHNESKEDEKTITAGNLTQDTYIPVSPSDTFSPTLGIPALFKIKDNTFSNKLRKAAQPWSPRSSLSGSERGDEELHQMKEKSELSKVDETVTDRRPSTEKFFKPKEVLANPSLLPLSLLPNGRRENPKKPQVGDFLAVPNEEDRFSDINPSSEGLESLKTSTVAPADDTGVNNEAPAEKAVSKVPSEHSGSTCSGNESQTGLPKPPAILPKSEKAVLKAMKLTNRRMKKEGAQKSSQSSGKNKSDGHKSDKPELRGGRNGQFSEDKQREKVEATHHRGRNGDDRREKVNIHSETYSKTRRQSHDSVESNHNETLSRVGKERQGRSSTRQSRDKPEPRHYSCDRIISNVPVYKVQLGERAVPGRMYNRSQSIDRYIGHKVERRLSADVSLSEKLDPRSLHIEKSIMDEFQRRGNPRDKEKQSAEKPLRRSHSIDAYTPELPPPSALSRQSSHTSHTSHTSQLSRQSSIEHAIVAQSFPITQRKLLQDPDSGQYFFVDMPVQVKTKTFFDPETGSYVQLPVQPSEGAVLQASPMEVLTPPLVVYHGFVPVPLSPMARKATMQAPHVEPEELRNLERSRKIHCKEGQPYLEPVYGQHDHMLGEFLATEEVDCPS